ncbi:hypothetical protein IKS73_03470 [bacterium]|nr:hypothetical protein [bacterium]
MKKTLILIGVAVYVMIFMTGCATFLSKSEYDVQICSSRNGDRVSVRQGYKIIATQNTPYSMRLKASRDFLSGESYVLEYVYPKNGEKEIAIYNASIDPWIIGSFIFGGFIYILIDGASGAMYKLPDQFYICTDENQFNQPTQVLPATPSEAPATVEININTNSEAAESN